MRIFFILLRLFRTLTRAVFAANTLIRAAIAVSVLLSLLRFAGVTMGDMRRPLSNLRLPGFITRIFEREMSPKQYRGRKKQTANDAVEKARKKEATRTMIEKLKAKEKERKE